MHFGGKLQSDFKGYQLVSNEANKTDYCAHLIYKREKVPFAFLNASQHS